MFCVDCLVRITLLLLLLLPVIYPIGLRFGSSLFSHGFSQLLLIKGSGGICSRQVMKIEKKKEKKRIHLNDAATIPFRIVTILTQVKKITFL